MWERLRDSGNFVPLAGSDQIYYGGDQAWFSTVTGRCGGCGTVAAANVTAYLAMHSRDLEALCPEAAAAARGAEKLREQQKTPPQTADSRMTQAVFACHMERMYRWVRPWKVPFVSENRPAWKWKNREFGWTFGVWPPGRWKRGVERYARASGACLYGTVLGSRRPLLEITAFVAEHLRRDCPVAVLIGRRPRYELQAVVRPDGSGWLQRSFAMHWAVITEISDMREPGTVMVRISTWGGSTWLDLGAWQRAGSLMAAVVGFTWKAGAGVRTEPFSESRPALSVQAAMPE